MFKNLKKNIIITYNLKKNGLAYPLSGLLILAKI